MAGDAAYPYDETNKPLGAPRAALYYHDANENNENLTAVADFSGQRFIRGVNCVDRASGPAICDIWLETHPGAGNGSREVCAAGCYVLIYYGAAAGQPTHIWETTAQVVGADVFIQFADVDNLKPLPGAPTGIVYNNAAFIDGLDIIIFPEGTRPEIVQNYILWDNSAAGGYDAADIPRAAGASDVETDLAAVETDFAVEHTALGPGLHNPEIIHNDTLDVDCFAPDADTYESTENLVNGFFDYDSDGDGVVDGWEPYLAPPTVMLSAVFTKRGLVSQLVTTLGPGPGIHAVADVRLNIPSDFYNMEVSFSALVRATANDTVVLEINDGVGVTTRAAGGTAGAWEWLHVSRTMNALATTCEVRIYANAATTFYVDGAHVHYGRLNMGYTNSPGEAVDILMGHSDYDNWLPNGDFKDWTQLWGGAAAPSPDGWTVTAGAPVIARNAVTFLFGQYSMDVTMNLGDAIQTGIINPPNDFNIYDPLIMVSFYYILAAGAPGLQVTIDDGIVPVNYTIFPGVGWQRFISEPFAVAAGAAFVNVTITCLAGGQTVFDGFMLHKGWVPQAFKESSIIQPHKYDYVMQGGIVNTNMTTHGSLLENLAPSDMYLHKLKAYSALGVPGVVDQYDVMVNGAAAGITALMGAANQTAGMQVPGGIFVNQGDRIQVFVTPGLASAAGDISAVVEGLKIGS